MITLTPYTKEDIISLMRKLDDSAGQYKKVVQFEETFLENEKIHTIKQSTKHTIARVFDSNMVSRLMKPIFKTQLNDMPLHINDPVIPISIIAQWRLELGK